MPRLRAELLAPLAAVAASLALPFASLGSETPTVGTATSVNAREANLDGDARPADRRFPIGGDELRIANDIARAHWNANPCGGTVEMTWVTIDPMTNATASWRNPTDAWNNAAENFDCRIELNTAAEFDFAKLCTVVTHEIGHLVGQQHAAEPGRLMSPYYSDPLPACVSRPAAPPAPATAPAPGQTQAMSRTAKAATRKPSAKRRTAKKRTLDKRYKRRCVLRYKASKRGTKRVKRCFRVRAGGRHKPVVAKRLLRR